MTEISQPPVATPQFQVGEATEWVRRNAVTLAAVALIAIQLWWKAELLTHFYFRQDDFQIMDQALARGFSPSLLFAIDGGHLMPGGLAIAAVLVRISMYDWALASTVNVLLLAAAGLAMLRLLSVLFGKRPAILIPLAIFLFCPLTIPGLSFWVTTLQWLPLQLTILMALGSHVKYLRTGRTGSAVAAAIWIAAGMLFDDASGLVPLLVFAVTSAYFAPGDWLSATKEVLRKYRLAWIMYGALTLLYVILFLDRLQSSAQQPGKPGLFSGVLSLASTMVRVSFVSGAFGGPWRWYAPGGDYGYAAEAPVLTQLAWAAALIVLAATLWYRRRAIRAWIILAGWIAFAALGPVILSRSAVIGGTLLGLDTHYLATTVPILAICVGLACWPVAGEENAYRTALPPRQLLAAVTVVVMACFLVGSIWSGISYTTDTSSAASQSYLATAQAALNKAEPGTVILSTGTPQDVMYSGFLGAAAQTSQVFGPLVPVGSHIRFTTAPTGQIGNLMIFNSAGQLLPATDVGTSSVKPPTRRGCWSIQATGTTIPLRNPIYDYGWIVQLFYSGAATTVQVRLGTGARTLSLPAGTHHVYVPVTGAGKAVDVTSLSAGPTACITSLTVGLLNPSKTALPLPFYPVR